MQVQSTCTRSTRVQYSASTIMLCGQERTTDSARTSRLEIFASLNLCIPVYPFTFLNKSIQKNVRACNRILEYVRRDVGYDNTL